MLAVVRLPKRPFGRCRPEPNNGLRGRARLNRLRSVVDEEGATVEDGSSSTIGALLDEVGSSELTSNDSVIALALISSLALLSVLGSLKASAGFGSSSSFLLLLRPMNGNRAPRLGTLPLVLDRSVVGRRSCGLATGACAGATVVVVVVDVVVVVLGFWRTVRGMVLGRLFTPTNLLREIGGMGVVVEVVVEVDGV